jgi:SNF2 family DNA or RNA helicase
MSVTDLHRHLKPDSLSWFKFHTSQKRKLLSLGGYDIIITTYETLMGQMKKHNDATETGSTLFSFAWHRIILDEGIFPKISHAKSSEAC